MPNRNRSRRDDDEDQEERRPRASRNRNAGFPVGPALGVVALIALAYLGTKAISVGPAPEPPKKEPYVPFANLAEEGPPDPSSRSGARWVDNAPAGLADSSPAFAAARGLAAEGEGHLVAARSADSKRESSAARDFRKQAHTAYNQAFEDTALWEMEIEDKYSDRDRQVEKIKKERSRWMQKIIALHKTTGR
jgi:hypothetical protein